jgi:hypothetical protein
MKQAAETPWHERKLPPTWNEEEVRFFSNWLKGVVYIHNTLAVAAASRLKLLYRARKTYRKLARQLTKQIRVDSNRGGRG